MAIKKSMKKKRYTKRTINISELTQKKLNRLNRRLHKRNLLQHDLIEKRNSLMNVFLKERHKMNTSLNPFMNKNIFLMNFCMCNKPLT